MQHKIERSIKRYIQYTYYTHISGNDIIAYHYNIKTCIVVVVVYADNPIKTFHLPSSLFPLDYSHI